MTARPLTYTIDEPNDQSGFSLLETLFALAIMSLASVALFQSTSSMLSLSDRAVKAGERTVSSGLDRLAVRELIDGLLPPWPYETDRIFIGEPAQFRGQSTAPLSANNTGAEIVTLSLISQATGGLRLDYSSAKAPEGWTIMSALPDGTRFEYMGIDHQWYSKWPPQDKPGRGFFNEDELLPLPALPQAIRLRAEGRVLLSARVSRAVRLPDRFDPEIGL